MATRDPGEGGGTLVHWWIVAAVLGIGGLLLSARAADSYTHLLGLIFAGFGVLLAGRLMARVLP
ncbi:hypothetical protein [Muricoccus radiodurans]|uniref:hypothetical protein n=1 Tax=Muricoccus radiodurans TaxID=2231721 RepID=UPI003CEA1E12